MPRLSIYLLGGFRVTLDERPLTEFVSDKARALLAYLAIESERPQRRETLAALLWPDRPDAVSRTDLRQTLHRLREIIGDLLILPPYIQTNSQELQFNNRSNYWLDVSEFSQSFNTYQSHHPDAKPLCEDCLVRLEFAMNLYQGDLLSGFSVSGCPHFEWWLLFKQEEYHSQAIETLDRLYLHCEQNQDYLLASRYAQRAIELEPWREKAHRQKMHALALGGQRGAALHQYQVCRQILAAELGVEPTAETTSLFQQISTRTSQDSAVKSQ